MAVQLVATGLWLEARLARCRVIRSLISLATTPAGLPPWRLSATSWRPPQLLALPLLRSRLPQLLRLLLPPPLLWPLLLQLRKRWWSASG